MAQTSQEDHEHMRLADDSPQPTIRNTLQKLPTPPTPRQNAHTMSPSHSPDSHRRAISPMHRHSSPARDQEDDGSITTPLLMPPPTTFLGGLRHSAYVKYEELKRALDDTTSPIFRFALFILKIVALARACWPVTIDMPVGGGLVVAAAVDLTWALDLKRTVILFLVHLVLVYTFQARGELCLSGHEPWDWDPAFNLDGGGPS